MAEGPPMKRQFFVPEVIQTSMMDCGPASLKALFGGHGVYLSYGRLREACQTDVDGTSIDTLESVAQELGLDARQSVIPADFLFIKDTASLPAIVVVLMPGGGTHFVVVWKAMGGLLQVMDPAVGRVWVDRKRFMKSVYMHEQEVPCAAWEEWSQTSAFTAAVEQRLCALGVAPRVWADRAHLDAALRLAESLVEAQKLKPGTEAEEFLVLCERNREQIPGEFWHVRETEDCGNVIVRGIVLLTATGLRREVALEQLPESLSAVLKEPPPRLWAPVWEAIRASGWLLPGSIVVALIAAAAGTAFEALLFRGMLTLAWHLNLGSQRLAASAVTIGFLGGLLALEWHSSLGLLRLGRHLELRLRTKFLLKIPRLSDQYFRSRLISDMAFRAHSLQLLRGLPELAGQFIRTAASMLFMVVAIAWFYHNVAWWATLAALAAVGIPLLFQPPLNERDLRCREMSGALSRFYLDALRGVRAIQAHCAERTMQATQSLQLGQWAEAGLRRQRLRVGAEALQMAVTFGLTIVIVVQQSGRTGNVPDLLLLIYWVVSISAAGQQLASIALALPTLRNTMLRFMEPLGSAEEKIAEGTSQKSAGAVRVDIENVTVISGGHSILQNITLSSAPGEHIGIVGSSGAGKSSLVGLLLGWHKPSVGNVEIDGAPLDAQRLFQLRREMAWIDPEVQLFRTSLLDNLTYGNGEDAGQSWDAVLEAADLTGVLERLPEGLQASVGEGGALLSGGEGQRVRIGRGLGRAAVRLAILDEPARGLDRRHRVNFLRSARKHFAGATLFCITHDITETLEFDRVLVIENGRICEQGPPKQLLKMAGSRYKALYEKDQAVQRVWSNLQCRRLRMDGGQLSETKEARAWTSA
jgi:ABC-type bacteriocin/lantibiotic exporter with double-glycine peptidase domain